ncbi:hypothetical protein PTKIN_Ptkin07bG0050500 [Pterospermum kingtungense]
MIDVEAVELDWSKRVDIVKGMAHALSYLHKDCAFPVVHRDISNNNILLNSNLEACVADFGIARIFGSRFIQSNHSCRYLWLYSSRVCVYIGHN